MDGRRRLAQPLKRSRHSDGEPTAETADAAPRRRGEKRRRARRRRTSTAGGLRGILERLIAAVLDIRLPRGAGIAASALLVAASLIYGTIRGEHVPTIAEYLKDARDAAANAIGFRITAVAISGQKDMSREEVLAIAGVNGRSSLLFLDVDRARRRLRANPWIADAALLKLYPDRLQISVTEREAFALWQKDGRVAVIAADGTVLEPSVAYRYAGLPLVVGRGAHLKAKDFLAVLDRYPYVREVVRASVLVAERRWNLRLKNGIDVRLPEADVERALATLTQLDREKKLISRDIAAIDLRLPDRVTVRLSDTAAQAREDAVRDRKIKRKGGDA
jgi:cell division protein FtsQ